MVRRKPVKKTLETQAALEGKRAFPMGLAAALGVTLVIGGIPFAMGKYIELSSPDPFDGGAYVYSAQHLLTGARLWVDEISSAMPGTLLANVLGVKLFGFSDVGPKVVQMLFQLVGMGMMFFAVRRLFGDAAAAVATTLAAIMLSAPVVAKFGDVKEQFMIPFAIVAACAFGLHEAEGKKYWAVIAGAASIIPYYFKPTGIAIVVAIGVYLAVKLCVRRRQWKAIFVTVGLWVAGAAIGLCFPASLYIWQKGMSRFWFTFPVVLLEAIVFFAGVLFAWFAVVHYVPWRKIGRGLGTVRRTVWAAGVVAIVLMLMVSMALVGSSEGAMGKQDVVSYVRSIPVVRVPAQGWGRLWSEAEKVLRYSGLQSKGGYVADSRKIRSLAEQAPQVLRYYHAVGAVTWGALATALLLAGRWGAGRIQKKPYCGRMEAVAGLWAVWWIVDMALVWVSPHSYEQYYLPLCASGAMLAGYAVWLWDGWRVRSANKVPAMAVAGVAAIALSGLLFPVFAGFAKSPDTGVAYKNYGDGRPERRRGFAQALAGVKQQGTATWQAVGDYIRENSAAEETLYVWGWFPGIYVRAQRMAPVPGAYEANMHVTPPGALADQIKRLVEGLENRPPRFIVDSRKQHFPFNRPPLELWPVVPEKMLGNPQSQLLDNDLQKIEAYERTWGVFLQERVDADEAGRFAAMKPFRDFVMGRYRPVKAFGNHMLFERRSNAPVKTP